MLTSSPSRLTSRRRFLEFLAASPLLACGTQPAHAQNISPALKPADPVAQRSFSWEGAVE
jgi:hypothetical protein